MDQQLKHTEEQQLARTLRRKMNSLCSELADCGIEALKSLSENFRNLPRFLAGWVWLGDLGGFRVEVVISTGGQSLWQRSMKMNEGYITSGERDNAGQGKWFRRLNGKP